MDIRTETKWMQAKGSGNHWKLKEAKADFPRVPKWHVALAIPSFQNSDRENWEVKHCCFNLLLRGLFVTAAKEMNTMFQKYKAEVFGKGIFELFELNYLKFDILLPLKKESNELNS